MTISECLGRLDALKHNTYTQEEKLAWLSQLDTIIDSQVIRSYDAAAPFFQGYGPDTPMDSVLLASGPFEALYLRFLEAQIDYHNGEYDRYNNAILLFNQAMESFSAHYLRQHKPEESGSFRY